MKATRFVSSFGVAVLLVLPGQPLAAQEWQRQLEACQASSDTPVRDSEVCAAIAEEASVPPVPSEQSRAQILEVAALQAHAVGCPGVALRTAAVCQCDDPAARESILSHPDEVCAWLRDLGRELFARVRAREAAGR